MTTMGEICTRDTIVLGKEGAIIEAARLMRSHHVGDIVVVEPRGGENVPVGILTDRDLVVEILAQELSPGEVAVGDVMSYELVTAREEDDLWDAVQRMRARGVRRMPVVNAGGGLVGIVTLDDLLELLAEELAALSRVAGREQEREKASRRAQ